jgi:predicted secreted Zn-dependent protease
MWLTGFDVECLAVAGSNPSVPINRASSCVIESRPDLFVAMTVALLTVFTACFVSALRGRQWAAGLALITSSACASGGSSDRPALGPVPDGVTLQARPAYYDVTGASRREILTQIREGGPISFSTGRRAMAQNRYNLRWRWQYNARVVGGCEIERVTVNVDMTLVYPRWVAPEPRDSALVAWWNQTAARLKEHEEGHGIITLDASRQIVRDLRGMRGGSCDALGLRASTLASQINQRLRERQQQFDASTVAEQRRIIEAIRSSH